MHWKRSAILDCAPRSRALSGFTLLELLVVISIIGVLSSLLLPALSRAKAKAQGIQCLNNLRQLNLAWVLYAQDNDDRLAHNFGASEIKTNLAAGLQRNWADSVLNWEADPDNTNAVLNTGSSLGPYLGRSAAVFRCPSDNVVSDLQRKLGWSARSRTYSMNAMVGDAGTFTRTGVNINNPYYHQYLKLSEFKSTVQVFVFIEEHPHSINDGYFLNRSKYQEWNDLPASFHGGASNLSFADGHAESHPWQFASTKQPAKAFSFHLPLPIPEKESGDLAWVLRHMSTGSVY